MNLHQLLSNVSIHCLGYVPPSQQWFWGFFLRFTKLQIGKLKLNFRIYISM